MCAVVPAALGFGGVGLAQKLLGGKKKSSPAKPLEPTAQTASVGQPLPAAQQGGGTMFRGGI